LTAPYTSGTACEIVTLPVKSCESLNATNCTNCIGYAAAYSINCAWCPSSNLTVYDLTQGSCTNDTFCGANGLYACNTITPFIPPSCPDNCTSNGICVNITNCTLIQNANIQKYGADESQWPTGTLTCGANLNQTLIYNHTSLCACFVGHAGSNCALAGGSSLAALAALSAGFIVLIVVLVVAAAAVAGGGAIAASVQTYEEKDSQVRNSPLYVDPRQGTDVQI